MVNTYILLRGVTMKIIAHRGKGGKYKENTKNAVLDILKKEFVDGVEIDVRMTKDHKFVIWHNPFYEGKLISITKYKHLKGLDKLDDLLNEINNKKIIMIEIKEEIGKYKIVVYYLYRILKKYNLNFYICSFNYKLMEFFVKKHPNITNGLIIGMSLNDNRIKNKFDFNSVNYKYLDKITSKETFIWTVNDEKQIKSIPMNCNVITDKPNNIYKFIYD